MTRINLVKPEILTKIHLVAEYKELTQVIYPMTRTASKGSLHTVKIPEKFCLNGGHVKFFYDKGFYLERRFRALYDEMKIRGMKLDNENYNTRLQKIQNSFPKQWYNDWKPDQDAYDIIIERIITRIKEKPNKYLDGDYFIECAKNPEKYAWF